MPSDDLHCDDHMERLVKLESDMNAAWGELKRHRAVLYGSTPDESGGIRGDFAAFKTWLKALTFFVGAQAFFTGSDKLAALLKLFK